MAKESIFTEEWRECLRAHYMDVIRRNDQITLKSLVRVMHDTGFNDDELAELRVRATMRADAMPDDFVPDPRIFQVSADVTPNTLEPDQTLADEEYIEQVQAELPDVIEEEVIEAASNDDLPQEPKEDPDAPQQLSLF
jgi:hypothetical protein